MAVDLATAYAITHQCPKLERAAFALTLTNNPAPGLASDLDTEAAAMLELLGGGGEAECSVMPNTVYELAPYGGEMGGTAEVRLLPDGTPIIHILSTI